MPRLAMRLAGFIFLLIALIHLGHIVYGLEFKVAGYVLPPWLNAAGTITFLLLSMLMFWSARMFSRAQV